MMESLLLQALTTVLMRPYVFVFLLIYLAGCSLHLGVKRAVLFCVTGYLIAWVSEYSSIHNGFPYGFYYYIEHTKGKELWVLGVPFMDSLSYVFLAYASYATALWVTSPAIVKGKTIYLLETKGIRNSFSTRLLGAVFFVCLDLIIDPVALRGDRWFLGRIYGYPEEGVYFGIPLSNFLGWFAVGFLMISSLQGIDSLLHGKKDYIGYRFPWRHTVGPALYFGVMAFNLSVTFFIREYTLGLVGLFIVLLLIVFVCSTVKTKLSASHDADPARAHLSDFPEAVIPGSAP